MTMLLKTITTLVILCALVGAAILAVSARRQIVAMQYRLTAGERFAVAATCACALLALVEAAFAIQWIWTR